MMLRRTVFSFGWVLALIAGCGQADQQASSAPALAPSGPDSLKVVRVSRDTVQKTVTLPGELQPYERVLVRAKVPGYIRKMNVDIGSVVSRGQVLALVEAPEVGTKVEQMTARMQAARSQFLASRDYYDRISAASKADGVVAPSELEKVRQQMLADSADYHAAMLEAASFREIGNYLAIVAPVSGVITKRNIVVGSFVGNPGDPPLFELENNQVLRLQVPVPEIYTSAGLAGGMGELTTRAVPDRKFSGKLVRKAGSIDAQTRSEVWEFEIPNGDGTLKPGSYADVRLRFVRLGQSLIVPVSAVATTLERRFVIRVRGGITEWVDVRPGFNMGDRMEVFANLGAGDTLAMKATEELKGGTKVIPSFPK